MKRFADIISNSEKGKYYTYMSVSVLEMTTVTALIFVWARSWFKKYYFNVSAPFVRMIKYKYISPYSTVYAPLLKRMHYLKQSSALTLGMIHITGD